MKRMSVSDKDEKKNQQNTLSTISSNANAANNTQNESNFSLRIHTDKLNDTLFSKRLNHKSNLSTSKNKTNNLSFGTNIINLSNAKADSKSIDLKLNRKRLLNNNNTSKYSKYEAELTEISNYNYKYKQGNTTANVKVDTNPHITTNISELSKEVKGHNRYFSSSISTTVQRKSRISSFIGCNDNEEKLLGTQNKER